MKQGLCYFTMYSKSCYFAVSREVVADKGYDLEASTLLTHNVEELFDLDAMLMKYKNFEKIDEGCDREMLKKPTTSANNQGIDIHKDNTVANGEDLEKDSILQFVAGELQKKRKKQVEDELSHNPKKSTNILLSKTRACKKL
ncbi:hypothetical protein L7F22_052274 [Adiantum nelumboides]|nr:hypothetical protein [Adiantum nelumboides]